ncbi:flagellar biosynthesis protein FlgA [Actinomycetes bacterium KLBMP 9797]
MREPSLDPMREPSLDPVRRPRLPRRGATLRAGLVAALLLTAAGALYLPEPAPQPAPCPPPSAAPTRPAPDRSALDQDGRLAVPAGAVGVPVRLAEPAALALLRPGDRVDLLAAGQPPTVVASNALVLTVAAAEGAVLLAVRSDQARRTAAIPPETPLTTLIHP